MPRRPTRADPSVSSEVVRRVPPATFTEKKQLQRELHSIEMVRRGIDLSPVAWVIPDAGELGPWTLPRTFDIAKLSPAEVKVGMSLGVLTSALLTSDQLEQYLRDLKGAVGSGTAVSLLTKIADAADCDRAADEAQRGGGQRFRDWLYPPPGTPKQRRL
jgi:hypothetical protein